MIAFKNIYKLSAVVALIFISASLLAISLPQSGWRALSVQTGSMSPAIRPGALVLVHGVPESNLTVGDVLTYINPYNPKQTITHRLIEINHSNNVTNLIVKGDANAVADAPVIASRVVGKVALSVPLLGTIISYLRSPLGLLIVLYLPALFILIHEMKLLIKRLSIEESSHLPKLDIPKLVLSPTTRIEPLSPTILNSPLKKRQFRNIDGVLVVIAILGIGFSWSISNTTAKLKTQAILKSTTIMTKSAPVTKYADHIVFRDVVLRCSNDNSLSSSLRPQITLFNPTNKNIVTHNWHIEDNSGNIYTLPINFVFHPRHIYELALHLSNGLQYVSDHLTLYNDLNVPVDGLSWGSDTTLLNPALPVLTAGTRLIRKPPRIDTNTSNDWQIHSHKCHENENECEKDTEADINNIRENKETDE